MDMIRFSIFEGITDQHSSIYLWRWQHLAKPKLWEYVDDVNSLFWPRKKWPPFSEIHQGGWRSSKLHQDSHLGPLPSPSSWYLPPRIGRSDSHSPAHEKKTRRNRVVADNHPWEDWIIMSLVSCDGQNTWVCLLNHQKWNTFPADSPRSGFSTGKIYETKINKSKNMLCEMNVRNCTYINICIFISFRAQLACHVVVWLVLSIARCFRWLGCAPLQSGRSAAHRAQNWKCVNIGVCVYIIYYTFITDWWTKNNRINKHGWSSWT